MYYVDLALNNAIVYALCAHDVRNLGGLLIWMKLANVDSTPATSEPDMVAPEFEILCICEHGKQQLIWTLVKAAGLQDLN